MEGLIFVILRYDVNGNLHSKLLANGKQQVKIKYGQIIRLIIYISIKRRAVFA